MIYVVETDLEPDDFIFILLLTQWLYQMKLVTEGGNKVHFVVGESTRAFAKVDILKQYIDLLFNQFPAAFEVGTIMIGMNSDKKYPLFLNHEHCPPGDINDIIDQYIKLYTTDKIDVAIMIKPPREALWMSQMGVTLPNVEAVAYGSFNWRTTMKANEDLTYTQNSDLHRVDFNTLMKMYGSYTYIDSFTCVGSSNSGFLKLEIENKEDGDVTVPITLTRLGMFIQQAITEWNQHIVDDCQDTVNDLKKLDEEGELDDKGKEKLHRNEKVIANVTEGKTEQFVVADPLVFLALVGAHDDEFSQAKLVGFDKFDYPIWEEAGDEASVYVVHNTSDEAKANRRKVMNYFLNEAFKKL